MFGILAAIDPVTIVVIQFLVSLVLTVVAGQPVTH